MKSNAAHSVKLLLFLSGVLAAFHNVLAALTGACAAMRNERRPSFSVVEVVGVTGAAALSGVLAAFHIVLAALTGACAAMHNERRPSFSVVDVGVTGATHAGGVADGTEGADGGDALEAFTTIPAFCKAIDDSVDVVGCSPSIRHGNEVPAHGVPHAVSEGHQGYNAAADVVHD